MGWFLVAAAAFFVCTMAGHFLGLYLAERDLYGSFLAASVGVLSALAVGASVYRGMLAW